MKNSDSVAVITGENHLLANEAYARLFYYDTPDEILAMNFFDLFDPGERNVIKEYLSSRIQNEQEQRDLKTLGKKKDGSTFMIEMSVSPCNPDSNGPELFLVAVRDNTNSCLIEEELEKSRRSLDLIRQCHQIFLREDSEQLFLDRICQAISRYPGYDLTWYTLRKDMGTLCTASFAQGGKEIGSKRSLYISSICMKKKETFVCNDIYQCPIDPDELEHIITGGFLSLISLPLIIEEKAVGALNIYSRNSNCFAGDRENLENLVNDISYGLNSIRLKEKQNDLEKQLLQAQKMETIGTLAGGIAHDFNNIMTPIMGYSEMIRAKMSPDDPLYQFNEQILNGAVRARELVKQIMAFSHKENHRKEPVYLDRIVKETLQLMSSLIPKTISIHKHLGKHIGKIMADPAQIHQIIANLCTNSFHAMEEDGGILTVELKKTHVDMEMKNRFPELNIGNYAQLIIGDSGRGMNRETKTRIFEPFFTTKPVGKGTGLGLSVVHGIIKNHNGLITVESEINLGTIFNIYFPILGEEETDAPPEEKGTAEVDKSKIILLLDDHRDITELLKIMLVSRGYSVESFNDSQKALDSFKNNPDQFALIITDLYIPQINGLEFIREVHRRRENLPSLIITGHEDELSEREKKSYNIKKIVHKPILRNSLLDAVAESLEEN